MSATPSETTFSQPTRPTGAPDAARLGASAPPEVGTASIRFIGAATVLLRAAGFSVLTDPAFLRRGEVARLGYGLRSMRRSDPAVDPATLPPLDLVLLSHLHGDHFDRAAARELPKGVPILTTPDGAATLRRNGFPAARGLSTWETATLERGGARLRITALPASHAYGVLGRLLPPVMGALVEIQAQASRPPLRLYITGDTLVIPALAEIAARFPDIDVMLPHLGGTRLLGLFLATMDGRQGVALMRLIPARTVVPIHYDDFTVYRSPLEDFRREVTAAGLEGRVRYIARGETLTFDLPDDDPG